MQLSSKGRYAVMAMADLAHHNRLSVDAQEETDSVARPLTISSVSERQAISQTFLEQIFMLLRRAGLVTSTRGPGGGYVLSRKPEEISIYAIMQAVEEPVQMTRCSLIEIGGCVDGNRCLTHDLWQDLSDHIGEFLQDTTLADVIKDRLTTRVFEAVSSHEVSS